jgi:hypothetical protein
MAHGKNKFKMPPMFKRDKDLLSIANDPKKFNALKAVIDQAAKMNENFKHFKNIHEWYCYVETLIPEFEKKTEFTKKLEELVYEYYDEPDDGISADIG